MSPVAPGSQPERVVVVGASLAGLRCAEELRRLGFTGSLAVVGDEPYRPYDRVPMSKSVVAGRIAADSTQLTQHDDLEVDWLLGVAATALDRGRRVVVLADGRELPYDRVLIATGTRARAWPVESEAAFDNVLTVRGRDDGGALRARIVAGPKRVLVVGAGFIGSEVASACRDLGIEVTLLERAGYPMDAALGETFGVAAAALQRDHGVDLRLDTSVVSMEDDGTGSVKRVLLDDGSTVEVDVVVAAVGSARNVEWLDGAGLAVDRRTGVACDATLRAFTDHAVVDDSVYAAGDVARVPHPVYLDQMLAVEHWSTAVEQGQLAARNMLAEPDERRPYTSLPRFWSNQFGVSIKSIGVPTFADQVALVQGSIENERFVLAYGKDGRTVAVVALNAPREIEGYEPLIRALAPFPPRIDAADWEGHQQPQPVPARFPSRASHESTAQVVGPAPDDAAAALGFPAREPAAAS